MRTLLLLLFLCSSFALLAQDVPADGRTHEFDRIDGVEVSHIYRAYIERGTTAAVRIEAPPRIREYIRASVSRGVLRLSLDPRANFDDDRFRDVDLVAYVTLPALNELTVSGAARVEARDVRTDGEVKLSSSGAARLEISGSAPRARITTSGASQLDANDFRVGQCRAQHSGASSAKLYVTESIRGQVSGAASLRYRGNPGERDLEVSGAARVRE